MPALILWGIMALLLITLLVRFLACLIVSIIAHELGHAAAGFIVGWEFRGILSGPFLFTKESRGWRFRFLPRRLLGGGRVEMVPKGMDFSRRHAFIMVAGGPLATALLLLATALLPRDPLTVCFLLANAFIAVAGWIPMVVNGQPNDAKILIRLVRARREHLAPIRELWALDRAGVEPHDWPPEVVGKLPMTADDMAYRTLARRYSYLYAKDSGDSARAAGALELVLACATDLPPDERRNYFAEAAFFHGVFAKDAAVAREWLDDARKVKDALTEKDWEAYPLAAIALAEGKHEQSREYLIRAIAALDRRPGRSGSLAATRAHLEALIGS